MFFISVFRAATVMRRFWTILVWLAYVKVEIGLGMAKLVSLELRV